jgi:hypothetical protein
MAVLDNWTAAVPLHGKISPTRSLEDEIKKWLERAIEKKKIDIFIVLEVKKLRIYFSRNKNSYIC